ncbi:WXG100 family type VII secretion target [Gordonia insulae]|uniref:Uncharacterized protein n=1 Tax=Gordonia insulae TaxID=2420509 RepID=A0A3G8JLF6_9ACTN|nr:WXG100 family type VII secretion target [Gordonia insulae]AZG45843.1 hypothetical protein D7316_02443 [Gordonia insulae]
MGSPDSEVSVDLDDVATIARVIASMGETSRDGWKVLHRTADLLREGWIGRRGDTFETELADLRKRVESAPTRLDEIPPKLTNAARTFEA